MPVVLQRTGRGAEFGDFVLDATVSESHTDAGQFTSKPLEDLTEANDHYIDQPNTIVVEGLWSDVHRGGASLGRSRTLLANLREAKKRGETFRLVTSLAVYEEVGIESISVALDPSGTYQVPVSISFKQLSRTAAVEVPVPPPAPAEGAKGNSSKVDRGKKAKKAAGAGAEKESSLLYKAFF